MLWLTQIGGCDLATCLSTAEASSSWMFIFQLQSYFPSPTKKHVILRYCDCRNWIEQVAFLALLHPILLFKKWVTCALRICYQHFVANKRMSAANPAQAVLCGDVFEEIFGASVSKCICVLQLIVDDLELFPEACR